MPAPRMGPEANRTAAPTADETASKTPAWATVIPPESAWMRKKDLRTDWASPIPTQTEKAVQMTPGTSKNARPRRQGRQYPQRRECGGHAEGIGHQPGDETGQCVAGADASRVPTHGRRYRGVR
jgi:hypothetical protein